MAGEAGTTAAEVPGWLVDYSGPLRACPPPNDYSSNIEKCDCDMFLTNDDMRSNQ